MGCGATPRHVQPIAFRGPPHTIRVALEHVPWPLTTKTRDERTLVRMLYPTPLRVDPKTNDVVAGLCTSWRARGRFWRLECGRYAGAVARAVHGTARGGAVDVDKYPYALTSADASVRTLPGPFALVSGKPGHVVMRRGGTTLDVRQMEAHAAETAFRAGSLDEAPVALGDIRAAQLDPAIAPYVHVRQLLAVDVVQVDHIAPLAVRRAWWQTADRADYDALVPEGAAPTAVSLVPGWAPERARPRDFRTAKRELVSLPLFRIDGDFRYGIDLLTAAWRDLHRFADVYRGHAKLVRVAADYPQDSAILARFSRAARATPSRRELMRIDERLYRDASVIPIAWVADARLVSPRLHSWSEDMLGTVDYARIRFRATTRRP